MMNELDGMIERGPNSDNNREISSHIMIMMGVWKGVGGVIAISCKGLTQLLDSGQIKKLQCMVLRRDSV